MKIKQITAFLLALIMVLSFAACGGEAEKETEPAAEPTTTEPATEAPAVDAPVMKDFSMNYSVDYVPVISLYVYDNGDGTYAVSYTGAVRKEAPAMDASVMTQIAEAYANSGLDAFNGQEVYGEGAVSVNFYATLADDTAVSATLAGEIPEGLMDAYNKMDEAVQEILADVPEYIPEPMVMGEIAENDKAAMDAILENLNIPNADSFALVNIEKNDDFASTAGLSSNDSTVSGVKLQNMMMGGAVYDLSLVTLADGVSAESVAQDFEDCIDWMAWVCVFPNEGLIATKDNQVLRLLGSETLFADTKAAIEAAGWTVVTTLENPNV